MSSSSAGATYLDRAARLDALRAAARRLAVRLPLVRRVVLFGSLAAGTPTPRSDADLLVILEASLQRQPRDRIPEALGALAPLPCPVDLFVVTVDEFERAMRDAAPLARVITTTGIDLL